MRSRLAWKLKVAVLSALAFLLMFVPAVPIFPPAPFLTYEPSEIPALVGGLLLGPSAGMAVIAVKSLLMLIYRCDPLSILGTAMNALAGVSLVGVASWRLRKNPRGVIRGIAMAVLVMTAVMVVANYFVFELFMKLLGVSSSLSSAQYVVAFCAPFNVMKGVLSGTLGYVIFKRLSPEVDGEKQGK